MSQKTAKMSLNVGQNGPKNDLKYSHGSKSCNESQTFLESAQQYFRTSAIVKNVFL